MKIEAFTEDFPSDKLVLIRLQSPDKVFMESRTEIVYLEDLKIAKFVNGVWEIEGPFPLFDFSPLSKFAKLNDDTIVTHWAELSDKEIEAWHHRFDNHFEYNTFKVEIDDDKKEDIYRALILAASCS